MDHYVATAPKLKNCFQALVFFVDTSMAVSSLDLACSMLHRHLTSDAVVVKIIQKKKGFWIDLFFTYFTKQKYNKVCGSFINTFFF